MDDFSNTYEKLIDMGFSSIAVDSAIEMGLYSFDDIFNVLVDKEQTSNKLSISNNLYQQNIKQDDNAGIEYEDHYPRLKLSEGDTTAPDDSDRNARRYPFRRPDDSAPTKVEVGREYYRPGPSSSSGSLVLSNPDSGNPPMTKIQIMDLLDPCHQPHTYSQPFMASICSVRDLICWFSQSRITKQKTLVTSNMPPNKSSVAISTDTDMHTLISLFDQLKWHLVLPSGATSLRIYGRENLDKHLDQLGLVPSAHLLAIVGCPSQLRPPVSQSHDIIVSNNSASILQDHSDFCQVHIRMVNYRHNPLYLHGRSSFKERYHLDNTILQKVVSDFSQYCGQDLSSFDLLQMSPSRVLSYPDDYLRSLRDLSFLGTVTIYCHSRPSSSTTTTASISVWDPSLVSQSLNNSNDPVSSFPGQGQLLQASHGGAHHTVKQVWSERSVARVPPASRSSQSTPMSRSNHKSLFSLSVAVLYRALKDNQISVCRHLRRLPNALQQVLIRQLISDHNLCPTSLSHFCTSHSGLLSLDLSYTSQATNELLRVVGKCPSLQELVLDNEDHLFTNDGLWHLRLCHNLRRLSINYCARITDWGLQVISEWPRLAVLSAKHTAITDLGLARILAPPPLTCLDLSSTSLTDHSLLAIAAFPSLQILNLASTAITDPASLPHLPLLQHVDLSHCRHLSWTSQSHIRSLSHAFPSLTSISVTDIDSHSLVYLSKSLALCASLRHIDGLFNHPQMTATLVATVAHLPLHSIVLTNAAHLNDLWLPVLARFSATLDHLVLSHCHRITGANDSLLNHLSRLAHLSWLDLTHLENVDSSQITKLVLGPYFPRMQVVWFSLTEEEEFHFRAQVRDTKFKINITRSLPAHHLS